MGDKISKRITEDEFMARFISATKDMTIVGEYNGIGNKIDVRCDICGNIWPAKPQHLLRGHGCPKCAYKNRITRNTKKTHQQFIEEMASVNHNIEIMSEYVNARTKLACKCLVCGYEWESKADNLRAGYGCKRCGGMASSLKQRKCQEDFVSEMSNISPDIEVIGEYINNKHPIRCRCLMCGTTWDAIPSNLLRGEGCPSHNVSHGEDAIALWLDSNGIAYVRQAKFSDLLGVGGRKLPYDFYVEEYNLFIEYQGNFHDRSDRLQTDEQFQAVVEHDRRKKIYAETHGNYLDIWYYDNLEEKLENTINNITNPLTTTAS